MMTQTVSIQYRLKITLMLSLFFVIGYGFTNHFPVFTPRHLPITAVDDFFGFHPWTVWIYMSDYFLIFLPIILIQNMVVMKRFAKGFLVNFLIHFPIFFFFPTTIHRSPVDTSTITGMIFHWLRLVDSPVNCFPSQHVSLCFVVAMAFWGYRNRWSACFFVWSALISISTMTTKQHYAWDVLGGLMVALIVCYFAFRKKAHHDFKLVP
jgi:membrane-associated phospholipid phosphatase